MELTAFVSTGLRQKGQTLKFSTGTVNNVKSELLSLGVKLVTKDQARYVVIPDGAFPPSRTLSQPIHYSEFMDMLASRPRMEKVKHSPQRPLESPNNTDAIWRNEVSRIEKILKK